MSKLGKAFFNLPIWQIVTTFSIIIGIVIGCFSLGKLYQENAANNLIYDYKTENNKLESELENSKNKNKVITNEILELREEINRLKEPKSE